MKKLQNVGRQSEAFFLNIIFCRIYQSGAKCILCCFVHVVHTELSEDILPVGIHGMETGKTLLGDFLVVIPRAISLRISVSVLVRFTFSSASCGGVRSTSIIRWQTKRLLSTQKRIASLISISELSFRSTLNILLLAMSTRTKSALSLR